VSGCGRTAGGVPLARVAESLDRAKCAGPGTVVATVAYDAANINAEFFTALLVLAIATSQAAAWLDYLIRSGSPLLSEQTSAVMAEATARANQEAPGSISAP
jgi:hypothetical protein